MPRTAITKKQILDWAVGEHEVHIRCESDFLIVTLGETYNLDTVLQLETQAKHSTNPWSRYFVGVREHSGKLELVDLWSHEIRECAEKFKDSFTVYGERDQVVIKME